jgi:DNA repair photolyase
MLRIPAREVYIDPEVYQRPNCRRRLERVLPYVDCGDVRVYDAEARARVAAVGARRHGKDDFGDDAVLAFAAFNEDRKGWYYKWRDEAAAHGGACQPGLQLNIVNGCVFRCAYCGFGRRIEFSLDVERFIDGLDEAFQRCPGQRLFKYSNMTDLPPFEPELNAIGPVVERFARDDDRYVMLFTKSDNVDFLRELDHRGHTIISWSLTCDTASRLVDKGTADLGERIRAMREMQACGYLVRARLSPIVPVRNWREEYSDLLGRLLEQVRPDVITMELLGWMEVKDLLAIFDREVLDEEAVRAAEESAEELKGSTWGPFTQETHEEVYRHCIEEVQRLSPKTPVSVCHGTPATWRALGDLMQMRPDRYVCNCGPQSAPGGKVYDEWWAELPKARG